MLWMKLLNVSLPTGFEMLFVDVANRTKPLSNNNTTYIFHEIYYIICQTFWTMEAFIYKHLDKAYLTFSVLQYLLLNSWRNIAVFTFRKNLLCVSVEFTFIVDTVKNLICNLQQSLSPSRFTKSWTHVSAYRTWQIVKNFHFVMI